MKFNTVVLIGMRGCGKSHFASCLAKELQWRKIDTDDEIEKKSGKKISEIVKLYGWDTFRDMEHEICKDVAKKKNVVISTGGGAITFERNRTVLKEKALTVFIFATYTTLLARLQKRESRSKRPALTNANSISDEIQNVWEERADIYFSAADIVFSAKDDLAKSSKLNVEKNAKILAKKIKLLLS